jgi:DNA-binding MarR family transcriptional regulator
MAEHRMKRDSTQPARNADAEAPEPELEGFIGYNLKRAYVILRADFRRALGEDGFSPRAFSALSLVVQYPNITQTGLARMLGVERSGLVAIVDDLERRGLIRRGTVQGDRRVQALMPTRAGVEALVDAVAAVRDHEDRLFAAFTAEERDTLMALLQKIRALGE